MWRQQTGGTKGFTFPKVRNPNNVYACRPSLWHTWKKLPFGEKQLPQISMCHAGYTWWIRTELTSRAGACTGSGGWQAEHAVSVANPEIFLQMWSLISAAEVLKVPFGNSELLDLRFLNVRFQGVAESVFLHYMGKSETEFLGSVRILFYQDWRITVEMEGNEK